MKAPTLVRPGPAEYRERGSVAVFTVVFAVAVIFLTALIVDGGIAMNAKERAADIAEQAARAAAGNINIAGLRAGGSQRSAPVPAGSRPIWSARTASRTAAAWTGSPAPP